MSHGQLRRPNSRMDLPSRWFTLFLALSIPNLLLAARGEEPKPPNFVIILADDLGFGDCGFTGSKQFKTPHIDALAQDGVVCSQGYVSAPVPLVVSMPGKIKSAETFSKPVSSLDLAPALVKLAGGDVKSDDKLDGDVEYDLEQPE